MHETVAHQSELLLPTGCCGSPRILIVDDDMITRQVLAGILNGAGFETVTAEDLACAEAVIAQQTIHLVLLDVHLPDGSGLDFCESLGQRSLLRNMPVLFISANDDLDTKVRGFAVGGVDYIPKPLAGAEVLARARTHLRLRAAFERLATLQAERVQKLASSQQALMPSAEDMPEAGFAACLRQIDAAGGDFYDVVASGQQIHDYLVADASGHDLAVSLWTASFKALVAEYASVVNTPPDICSMLNGSLRRILPDGAYFTAIYARLNRAVGRLQLVSCGHPAAVILRSGADAAETVAQAGDLLGIFDDAVFDHHVLDVRTGDRIFLYSDGLIEIDATRDEGLARLCQACAATADRSLTEAVPAIVDVISEGKTIADDIVLLGLEV